MNQKISSKHTLVSLPPRFAAKINSLTLAAAITACWLMTAAPASAQWSDNFDSYAAGSGMNGLGGWEGWGSDASAANAAKVNTPLSYSAPNSVRVSNIGGTDTDLVHQYSGYTSGLWTYSARMYIPSLSTVGTSYFILNDTYVNGGVGTSWAVETSFDLAAGTLLDDLGTGTLNIIRDRWVELRFDIDLTANNVKMYYDGVQYGNRLWKDGGTYGALAIAAVDLYGPSAAVYYDDLSLVPEPGTATLFAAFGLVGFIYRLRRRVA